MTEDNNGLRSETGALIGGLVVFDYLDGMADFEAGKPPPDMTTPSYDLGRQRAAEKAASHAEVKAWIARRQEETEKRMRDLLPPELYAEYRAQIDKNRAPHRT